jgi:hypothetical protein
MVQLQLRQLEVPPGQRVLLQDITWQEFEAILKELGEHRATRLAYDGGTLEIRGRNLPSCQTQCCQPTVTEHECRHQQIGVNYCPE